MNLEHKKYLESPEWAYIRGLVIKRDGFRCVVCNEPHNLNVHHRTYAHWKNELNHLGDLHALCRVCHANHHGQREKVIPLPGVIPAFKGQLSFPLAA